MAALLLLTVAACGSSDARDSASTPPTSLPPTTATVAGPTIAASTTATETPTASSQPDESIREITDLVYMHRDGTDFLMDVFVPGGTGPWPVVVTFHGCCGDPEGKDIPPTVAVAEAAARQGMVVFTPSWLSFDDLPLTGATPGLTVDRTACAIAFAQATAAEYGGDPARTVVDGFSAGATAGLQFASAPVLSEPITGCATDAPPSAITGFVLGDAESWLHGEFFDGAFATDLDVMQATVAAQLNPQAWHVDSGVEFFLWTSSDAGQPRIVDGNAEDVEWFAQRDADGSIQADLERLGQLDDDVVDFRDAAELLHLRLTDAGFTASLDVFPGAHTTLDKVPELVDFLRAAAS